MKRLHRTWLACGALACAAALPTTAVFAQRLVYDPLNHVENIITAVKTTASLITQTRQLEQDIRSNAASQPLFDSFAASAEMQELLGIIQAGQQLQGALRQSKTAIEDIQNVFGASPYGHWQEFASGIAERKDRGDEQATMLLDSAYAADQQVRQAYEANRKILLNLKSVSGPTQALQAAVNAVGTLIDQSSSMLYTMSAANKMHAQKVEDEALQRKNYDSYLDKYRRREKQAFERDAAIVRSLSNRHQGD